MLYQNFSWLWLQEANFQEGLAIEISVLWIKVKKKKNLCYHSKYFANFVTNGVPTLLLESHKYKKKKKKHNRKPREIKQTNKKIQGLKEQPSQAVTKF